MKCIKNVSRWFVWGLIAASLSCFAVNASAQFSAPTATVGGVEDVTDTSAWVFATVNAGGRQASVVFEYTTDATFVSGILKSEAQNTTSNTETLPVGIVLANLTSSTTYYFRAVATNQIGMVTGPILSFKSSYEALVIKTGDFVPGEAVQTVDVITPGLIGDDGVVAFKAFAKRGVGGVTSANEKLLLNGITKNASIIGRQGQSFSGVTLSGSFSYLTMGPLGHVYFQDQISGASASVDWGGFVFDKISKAVVNREGGEIFPGSGVTFINNEGKGAISGNGTAFFASGITAGSFGRNGIWFSNGTASGQLVREGVACLADGSVCGRIVTTTLVGTDTGGALCAPLSGGTGGAEAVISGSGPTLAVIVRKLDKPPGLNPIIYGAFRSVSAGSDTQFAFLADVSLKNVVNTTNDQILTASNAGVLSIVAREGNSVPGIAGGVWDSFGRYFVTASGDVLFEAFLRIGGSITTSNDQVFCRWSAGAMEILAREGARALGQRTATYRAFTNLSVNASGAYLIQATFSDGRVGFVVDGGLGQRLAACSGGRVSLNDPLEADPVIYSLSTCTTLSNLLNGTGGFGSVVTAEGSVFAVAYVGAGRYVAYVF
jgi:hypothetical protein